MPQREAFEAWATTQHIDATRDGFGGYMAHCTESAFEGWEAAIAQKEAQQEPVAYLAWRDGKPCWEGDDCVCEDAVYPVDGDDDRTSMPVYLAPPNTAPISLQPAHDAVTIELLNDKVMRQQEVLRQCLEALDDTRYVSKYSHIKDAIAAIREQLGEMK